MPMPSRKPWSRLYVDRDDLVVEQVDQRDRGLLAGELRRGPLADLLAGQEVVGREGDVDRLGVGGRRVERDHEEAGVAGLHERVLDGGAVRRDQDAGVALGDGVLDGLDLGVLVAVLLAGGHRELDAEVVGGGLGAILHGDEERVGRGLDDERDADRSRRRRPSVAPPDPPEAHPVKASAAAAASEPAAMRRRRSAPGAV